MNYVGCKGMLYLVLQQKPDVFYMNYVGCKGNTGMIYTLSTKGFI